MALLSGIIDDEYLSGFDFISLIEGGPGSFVLDDWPLVLVGINIMIELGAYGQPSGPDVPGGDTAPAPPYIPNIVPIPNYEPEPEPEWPPFTPVAYESAPAELGGWSMWLGEVTYAF